jgi:nucleoside-diphosphate-sugar epimerase
VRLLLDQGHEVHALAASRSEERALHTLGATPVPGDVTDRASLEAAMAGCDTVFHAANQQLLPGDDPWQAQTRIVAGTQNTLGAAHDLDIPHTVFVSAISIFGDTQGKLVDETYVPPQPPAAEVARALWRAHYEVALPLIAQGAPITIVMLGAVYGPGDTGWTANLMRRFYRGSLPVVPAPETTLTYAYVEDVVKGCILAAEKGRLGETYCLTGPAIPLGELVEFWSRLTGRRAPAISLSTRALQTMTPFLDTAADHELLTYLGGTYMARSDKARDELGWKTQPMQPTTLETFEWIAATEPASSWEKDRHLSLIVAGGVVGLLLLWLFARRGDDSNED